MAFLIFMTMKITDKFFLLPLDRHGGKKNKAPKFWEWKFSISNANCVTISYPHLRLLRANEFSLTASKNVSATANRKCAAKSSTVATPSRHFGRNGAENAHRPPKNEPGECHYYGKHFSDAYDATIKNKKKKSFRYGHHAKPLR